MLGIQIPPALHAVTVFFSLGVRYVCMYVCMYVCIYHIPHCLPTVETDSVFESYKEPQCEERCIIDGIAQLCQSLFNLLEDAVGGFVPADSLQDKTSLVEKCCILYNRLLNNIKLAGNLYTVNLLILH